MSRRRCTIWMVCLQCSRPGTHSIGGSPGFPPAPRLPALASRPPLGGREGPRARMRPGLLSPAQPGGSSRGLHLLPHCRGKKGSTPCHLLRLRGQQPLRTLLRPHLAVPGAHGAAHTRESPRPDAGDAPALQLTLPGPPRPVQPGGLSPAAVVTHVPITASKGPGPCRAETGGALGFAGPMSSGGGRGTAPSCTPALLWRQPLREPRVRPRLRSRRNGSPRAPWSLSWRKSPVSSVSLERGEAQ